MVFRTMSSSSNVNTNNPPLIILGGMAQSSWEFHLLCLSRHWSVLIYEALSQGLPRPSEVCAIDGSNTKKILSQCFIGKTGQRFLGCCWRIIIFSWFLSLRAKCIRQWYSQRKNLCCWFFVRRTSFNGRRITYLTGVEAEYDGLANVILASWKEIMGSNYIAIDDVEMEEECDPINCASKCTSHLWSFLWSSIFLVFWINE